MGKYANKIKGTDVQSNFFKCLLDILGVNGFHDCVNTTIPLNSTHYAEHRISIPMYKKYKSGEISLLQFIEFLKMKKINYYFFEGQIVFTCVEKTSRHGDGVIPAAPIIDLSLRREAEKQAAINEIRQLQKNYRKHVSDMQPFYLK